MPGLDSGPAAPKPRAEQRQTRGPSPCPRKRPVLNRSVPRAPRANGIVSARGDGHSMTYHQIIARVVDELIAIPGRLVVRYTSERVTPTLAQSRTNNLSLSERTSRKERRALEEAISTVRGRAARELRTEPLELGIGGGLPGRGRLRPRIPMAATSFPPPRRDRARPPSTPLPEDEWPAVRRAPVTGY